MMQVLTANDFRSGAVVYWGDGGWVQSLRKAVVFSEQTEADQALARAEAAPDQVVGAYVIAVTINAGAPAPLHIREVIRANGPSHQETSSSGGSIHVPIR